MTIESGPRRRTITWGDPGTSLTAIPETDGLGHMQRTLAGEIPHPPISELANMRLVHAEPGRARFEIRPDESMLNPMGVVHGGIICTVLDAVLGSCAQTTVPKGSSYTSIEIKVNYLRPVHPGGVLIAEGTVAKSGRRVIFADGTLTDGEGRLCATASSSLLVFPVGAERTAARLD